MKKKILLVAAVLTAGMTFAQDGLTSKKGVPILPEAGDYAIGFDAANVVNYGGNLFNGNLGNSAPNLDLIDANTIYGKYFVDANTAYRGMLRIGFGNNTVNTIVAGVADPTATFEDENTVSSFNVTLGGGMEYRRGKGRLQGVYGPMAMINFGSSNIEDTFGEDLSANNTNNSAPRTTEVDAGGTFGITVAAFGGVEYFFAPKISVGAEVMWGISYSSTGEGETTSEFWNGTAVETTTDVTGNRSSLGIDVTPNTTISLNFHF